MTITFLGTGGGRVVTAKQLRQTGGFILRFKRCTFWFDPGPGALVHARRQRIPVESVRAVLISHNHLDHVADINPVVEAITLKGGKVLLLAPEATLREKVLYTYLHDRVNHVALDKERETTVADCHLSWFPLNHTTLTFGFHLYDGNSKVFTYVSDTAYFPELSQHISGTKLLVVNVLFPYKVNIGMHLSVPDLDELLRGTSSPPEMVIVTHLGGRYIGRDLRRMELELSSKTGVTIKFARDNWRFTIREGSQTAKGVS